MKKFLFRTACFLLIQVGVGLLLLPPDRTELKSGYMAALRDKVELVKTTPGSRVLFVGGSNVAFGVDSGYFESALGRPAINLGLHGALGLEFYLRVAEEHARPGDIIVLLPEYSMLRGQLEPNERLIRMLLRQHPGAARYVDWKNFCDEVALSEAAFWTQLAIKQISLEHDPHESLVREMKEHKRNSQIVMKRLARELLSFREKHGDHGKTPIPMKNLRAIANSKIKRKHGVYRRSDFNDRGDMVGHHHLGSKLTAKKIRPVGAVQIEKLERVADRLNAFARACRTKGVTLYLSYSPLPQPAFKGSRRALSHLHRNLKELLDIPIVNSPETLVFPQGEFYDSMAHLTLAGKKKRSRILLEGLVRHLPAGLAPQQASRKQKARQ
ncbi:MAG: hypothetical protein N2C14_16750 [Planctomycetales bacterium]